MIRVLLVSHVALLLASWAHPTADTAPLLPDATLIVPGERIGRFSLGRDTQRSVLGDNSTDRRAALADEGVLFEFDRGGPLTGVTVTSSQFSTSAGLRVGASVADVEAQLGPPLGREVREFHGKFVEPALLYHGIWFFLSDDRVCAIRICR